MMYCSLWVTGLWHCCWVESCQRCWKDVGEDGELERPKNATAARRLREVVAAETAAAWQVRRADDWRSTGPHTGWVVAQKINRYLSEWRFSLCFKGHFPDGSGLAGTRTSPFWILLELRMMEVVVTAGALRCAKLESNRHHQQTNTQFFYRPDALPVVQPTEWKMKCEKDKADSWAPLQCIEESVAGCSHTKLSK